MNTATDRARQDRLDDARLQNEITRALAEYQTLNRKFFNAAELNDLRRHYTALNGLPELLAMLAEEIQIIRRSGPRPAPWWDMIDEHY
jgi:hypothetical protein